VHAWRLPTTVVPAAMSVMTPASATDGDWHRKASRGDYRHAAREDQSHDHLL